jgi:hypothetical protein
MTLRRAFSGSVKDDGLLMSDGELSRLEVLRDLDQERLTTRAAAQLLGRERRQIFRLLKACGPRAPRA